MAEITKNIEERNQAEIAKGRSKIVTGKKENQDKDSSEEKTEKIQMTPELREKLEDFEEAYQEGTKEAEEDMNFLEETRPPLEEGETVILTKERLRNRYLHRHLDRLEKEKKEKDKGGTDLGF